MSEANPGGERVAEIVKRSFNAGYLIAVANIMNLHGEDTVAEDVLGELGVSESVLRGLDLSDYDLKPLRQLFRSLERRRKAARQRAHLNSEAPNAE